MILKPSIWVVFGTRPEAIKMLPLVKALRDKGDFDVTVCSTGQHKEMLHQVFDAFDMKPDIELDVMTPNQTLTTLTNNILTAMDSAFEKHGKPDRVLVHGDTTSAFACALAAFYRQVPVGHVEAGLRTFDISTPFPEEGNRQLVKVMSDAHFAPTPKAQENLVREGVQFPNVFITGNTVIDGLLWMKEIIAKSPDKKGDMADFIEKLLKQYDRYVLVTGHRRENHGGGFERICDGLEMLAEKYPSTAFIYPVHLNPNVVGPVKARLGHLDNIKLIEPQSYAPFVFLMSNASIILTDSGGVQEEAPSLNVPVLVMRDVTEREEAVTAGTVKLVGTNAKLIFEETSLLLDSEDARKMMTGKKNPYGDGKAAIKIAELLSILHNIK